MPAKVAVVAATTVVVVVVIWYLQKQLFCTIGAIQVGKVVNCGVVGGCTVHGHDRFFPLIMHETRRNVLLKRAKTKVSIES